MCPINQRQYGKKLMNRQVVATDPEGGSKNIGVTFVPIRKVP